MPEQLTVPAEPSEHMIDVALSNQLVHRYHLVCNDLKLVLRLAYIEMTRTGAAELKECSGG